MTKKRKFSEFNCKRENHKNSKDTCLEKYSRETLKKFKIRCLSQDKKDKYYINHCKKIQENYKSESRKNPTSALKNRSKNLKRCEICKDCVNNNCIIFCEICEDAYHFYCINSTKNLNEKLEEFICLKCENTEYIINNYKQKTVDQSFELSIKRLPKKCHKCKEEIKEINILMPSLRSFKNKSLNSKLSSTLIKENEINFKDLKNCTRCKKDFHKKCFEKTQKKNEKNNSSKNLNLIDLENNEICILCHEAIKTEIKNTKISDYFKTSKKKSNFLNTKKKMTENTSDIIIFDFDQNNKSSICYYPKFILWKPFEEKKMEILKKKLLQALLIKNIEFSDDLKYLDEDCPESMNNSGLEPGIQKMSLENKKTFYKFKELTRQGDYPGLEIFGDKYQGFIVKSTIEIKKNTLICEYCGEVSLLRKKLFDNNDSIMELIRNPSSSNSLVICPEKKGNIARFISGINNLDAKAKKKLNLNSARFDIDGTVHVILYASRNIKPEEVLYYDYNAGGSASYPTENFI